MTLAQMLQHHRDKQALQRREDDKHQSEVAAQKEAMRQKLNTRLSLLYGCDVDIEWDVYSYDGRMFSASLDAGEYTLRLTDGFRLSGSGQIEFLANLPAKGWFRKVSHRTKPLQWKAYYDRHYDGSYDNLINALIGIGYEGAGCRKP